jgi:hypothetical protein
MSIALAFEVHQQPEVLFTFYRPEKKRAGLMTYSKKGI